MSMNYGPPPGPPQGPPMVAYAHAPVPPPKKKGISTGCIIAIVAVLAFFGTIGGVVFYLVYRVSHDPDVQHVMGALGDVATLAAEAQTAPGTNELRAMGCEQALALDAEKMKRLVQGFVDAGPGASPSAPAGMDIEKIVMCKATMFGTPPKCDDAAKAYARAAGLKGQFMLSVQQNNKTQCGAIYSAAGANVAPISTTPGRP